MNQHICQAENITSDATSGLVDVEAEWEAISAGTHAPTGVTGYRTLIEAALADERPDLAIGFATHLLTKSG